MFALVCYPACFLLTWLRDNHCIQNPSFATRPCGTLSNTEIAAFSAVMTIILALVFVPSLPAWRR